MTQRVVVVVPAYDGEATIAAAIASIAASVAHHRARRADPAEVMAVIVDDASPDGSASVAVAALERHGLAGRITRHECNRGTCAARNTGAALVDSDVLMFLDQDDLFLPGHIDVCLELLAAYPQCGFAKTGVELNQPVHPDWLPIIANTLVMTMAVRTPCHQLAGGFYDIEGLRVWRAEDMMYSKLMGALFRGVRTSDVTIRHHHRADNSFDRQLAKFQAPPGTITTEEALTEAEREAMPSVHRHHARHLGRVRRTLAVLTATALERE